MRCFFRYRAVFILLAVLPLTGCLFRSRKVDQTIIPIALKTASQQQLIDYVNSQATAVQSLQATVDIDTTVGGVKKGKVTDYQEIRGYVLARKPAMLRMIGLLPIVRNRAFDMVSDGEVFKLWVPPKNRFVMGRNDVQTPNPAQPIENVRPQHIYDALLIRRLRKQFAPKASASSWSRLAAITAPDRVVSGLGLGSGAGGVAWTRDLRSWMRALRALWKARSSEA